jgi:uncharacterized lipoprotein YddW (UPF0748 family)
MRSGCRKGDGAVLRFCVLTAITASSAANCAAIEGRTGDAGPPPVAREFRGVWVATVENIDWPSRPGLPTDKQKSELIAIFDKCVELNLNAVIFQIRTQADAFYPSKLEPWSEFISGRMGEAPKPFYDPLEFAVREAHRRGLQLHVWFNPYRVRVPGAKGPASPDHASVAHANIVRKYGKYLWFDPGEPAAEDYFIAVLNDVVKRYDIDGVHIDDYFYPYQVKDTEGKVVPFPDEESYARAKSKGEKLGRDDWRRQNVDHLVRRMYEEVKKEKPWVLVGISPFGIWRPGNPPGIVGLDQYNTLYADARRWEQEGWLDYLTPQLYWQVESKGQSYPRLLGWWSEQNAKKRHLWPGNFTSKIRRRPKDENAEKTWTAHEIVRQIEATRATPGATGNVHFSMKALLQNYDGINDKLKTGVYAEPALVPDSPWLGKETPGKPEVMARLADDGVEVTLSLPQGKNPWQWLLRAQTADGWKTMIVPGEEQRYTLKAADGAKPKTVIVSAVSRLGREGRPTRVEVGKGD